MTQTPAGYNNGQYDLTQQTFCLSMLTCLSFNLTGSSADVIAQKFKSSVENVLNNPGARALIGTWNLVWGPVVYADSFVGAKASVNSMFIAVPSTHPEQAVIAIAGTNGISLVGWMIEDFNVKDTVPWPYGSTPLNPLVSKGVAYGLGKLMGLAMDDQESGVGVTVRDYLAAHPAITQIMVTGHSLGGALAPVYSLYLDNTQSDWNPSGQAVISVLATAGQSPGNADFSQFYGERLASTTQRVWNSLDVVPHTFNQITLLQIPPIYEPYRPSQKPIEKLVANLRRETVANNYLNIMPEVEGFPSTFMTLESIAGDKYKTFVDFINNVSGLVKKANPFGSNDIVGSVEFVVDALLQHIFPYFSHFQIDEFIKIMCLPAAKPSVSVWERVKSVFQKKNDPATALAQRERVLSDPATIKKLEARARTPFLFSMPTKGSASEKHPGATLVNPPVIVDLGLKTNKKIAGLKKAEGPLYDAVCDTVGVLQEDGVVGKEVQVVVVVVEKLPDGFGLPYLPWN